MHRQTEVSLLFWLLTLGTLSMAQSAVLNLPRQGQHALLTQRVGLTDITINHHRPLVNGRKVWGGIVPSGEVWRAGANENTTITFTDPVKIEGQALDKGTYGLHMIPTPDEWTVIFSKASTAWGSDSYDAKEDALRVKVKQQSAGFREELTYDFEDVKPDAAVVTMHWEKLAVPLRVEVDTHQIVSDSLRQQLRGIAQYSWQGWDDAANYLLDEKFDLEEALKYADRSIEVEERFDNLLTKSRIQVALGQNDAAKQTLAQALDRATPFELHLYARRLPGAKRQEDAFRIFRSNYAKHPDQWFVQWRESMPRNVILRMPPKK